MKILDMVGDTPLLELSKISIKKGERPREGIRLFAKAEFGNPSGSVKDRAARAMILDGIEEGKLMPGKTNILLVRSGEANRGVIGLYQTGHHCAQPVLRFFGLEGTVRPPVAFYNTFGDIDKLVAAVREVTKG